MDDELEIAPPTPPKSYHEPRKLKPWSWTFLASLPVVFALMCLWYWQFALVSVFLFALPSARLYAWWARNKDFAGPLDHLVSSYAQGFYLVFFVASVCAVFAFVVTISILGVFVALAGDSTFASLLVVGLGWIAWVCVEELWKVTFSYWQKKRRVHVVRDPRQTKAWVVAATATAFGYATSQSILFTCAFAAIEAIDKKITDAELGYLFLFAFIFGSLSMPMTILTSYLQGLELTKDDSSFVRIVAWPVLLRSLYVFQFYFWVAVFGPVSFLLALFFILLTMVAVYYATFWRIRHVEAELPLDFMRSVAPLRRELGFALLSGGPDDDDSAGDTELMAVPSSSSPAVVAPQDDAHPL